MKHSNQNAGNNGNSLRYTLYHPSAAGGVWAYFVPKQLTGKLIRFMRGQADDSWHEIELIFLPSGNDSLGFSEDFREDEIEGKLREFESSLPAI